MEVSVTLNVKAEEFFDLLLNSILADAKTCNENTELNDIVAGFVYEKSLIQSGKNIVRNKVEIICCDFGKVYSSDISNGDSKYSIEYSISEGSDEDEISVCYKETAKFVEKSRRWNWNAITLLTKRKNEKKVKNMLYSMEDYIISSKEN